MIVFISVALSMNLNVSSSLPRRCSVSQPAVSVSVTGVAGPAAGPRVGAVQQHQLFVSWGVPLGPQDGS